MLVVEDHPEVGEMLVALVRECGHVPVLVTDAAGVALRLRQGVAFDLALIDLGLPHMDGFEVGTHLVSLEVPVVTMTARTLEGDRAEGVRLGFVAHLQKPFDLEQLRAIIARHAK